MEIDKSRVEVIEDENEMDEIGKDKEENQTTEIPEKTFLERVADLISSAKSIDGFSENSGINNFEKAIEAIHKKTGEQRDNLEAALRETFSKFYNENRTNLTKENLNFLNKDGIGIAFGASGKANLPMSEIYKAVQENNPELIDSIDAGIYFVMQHVCPDEDLNVMFEICSQYEQEEDDNAGNFLGFIGNIVGRVTDRIGKSNTKDLETEDGQINPIAVGNVVKDLIGDGDIQQSMQNMVNNVASEDFDISKVTSLFNMSGATKK